ncbi:hypothetical protein [Streptomyces sp. NPDC001091]
MATTVITAALALLLFGKDQPWEAVLLENSYASPWYLVGIGLLGLGIAERSWIVAAAATVHALLLTGYLGASWGSGWLPWQHPAHPGLTDGPQAKAFLLAAILLIAGLCEWTTVRRRGVPGPAGAGTVVS